jgi:ABC-type bacteriocin/lantibiotic exporter with double-glycine peptidase domain
MFTSSMVGLLADHQHFHLVMRAGLRLNGILGAQVQAKVLRLTPGARSAFSSGRIFSLVSSDAETLSALCMNVFGVISSPLRIAVALYLLYCQLGISCVVAVACLLLMIPTNVLMMKLTGAALKAALTHTDERTKLEGELVGGIEVVKCSAWELPFLGRVMQARIKVCKSEPWHFKQGLVWVWVDFQIPCFRLKVVASV